MAQSQPSFRPLEYWKPPKAVRHHIRAKSSAVLNKEGARDRTHSFSNSLESAESWEEDKKDMSFATIGEMGGRLKNNTGNHVQIVDDYGQRGPPPSYGGGYDRADTLSQPWWNVKGWGKKQWAIVAVALAILIAIIIAIAVVEVKKNKYPDYTTLSYSLSETYSGSDFFNNFDYYTGYDTTSGFVHYVPATTAASYNLTYASSSSAIMRVDTSVTNTTEPNASTGRFSVRVTSKKQYGLNNLFVFDVKHSPIGCGTWPALWLTDPSNWPANGEIDVMEAVNVVSSTNNQMTLHTSSGCTMSGVKRKEIGTILETSCVNTTNENAGCGIHSGSDTFGTTFNDDGGAVIAMELRAAGIRMWQFARDSVPTDIWSAPDPSTWSEATADFPNTDCSIENHFKNQSIIANIDLCGSWAGTQSIYGESCPFNCTYYVANYPQAFTDAYWEFGNFTIWNAS